MKKIKTLFERVYFDHKIIDITDNITPGCEEAFYHGIATVKLDGSCCAIINGELYKRYDAKIGKRKPPMGAVPCCEPDPVTGHWPHWVKVDFDNPADKWFTEAYCNAIKNEELEDGTYEALGPHFQGNPYNYSIDILEKHGEIDVEVNRDFNSIKEYLKENEIEGLVFWLDGEPVCKIKRTDFGLKW